MPGSSPLKPATSIKYRWITWIPILCIIIIIIIIIMCIGFWGGSEEVRWMNMVSIKRFLAIVRPTKGSGKPGKYGTIFMAFNLMYLHLPTPQHPLLLTFISLLLTYKP